MSIYRAPRPESNWTQIRNGIIDDHRITFKATAVLIYILSKPDNWRTSTRHLSTVKKEGIDAVRTAMSELEFAGYVQRRRYQDETGKWCYDTLVYDIPQPVNKPVRNTSPQVTPRGDNPYGDNADVYKELINKDYERIGLVPQIGEHKTCGQCRDTGWKVIKGLDLEKCGCLIGMQIHGR
tara:strand:+ start:66 stop:605 length:540 start_codon:yes stop_codon:yes gene_type:complete